MGSSDDPRRCRRKKSKSQNQIPFSRPFSGQATISFQAKLLVKQSRLVIQHGSKAPANQAEQETGRTLKIQSPITNSICSALPSTPSLRSSKQVRAQARLTRLAISCGRCYRRVSCLTSPSCFWSHIRMTPPANSQNESADCSLGSLRLPRATKSPVTLTSQPSEVCWTTLRRRPDWTAT